ncbi:MAG: type IIL restriction-modification enzyme MmeI [Polyangiaceae bacterium]
MPRAPRKTGLTPKERRTLLAQLPHARLAELTAHFGLTVEDRRSNEAHVEAIVKKRSLGLRDVLDLLSKDELKALCQAVGHPAQGTKAALVDRLLGVPGEDAIEHAAQAPGTGTPSKADVPVATENTALKSRLRRFVLDVAGGFRGRDAGQTFLERLLTCFGWPGGRPEGAKMPAAVSVIEGGQRATREVTLVWPERRLLVDVVKHDVMLDYAWKDLLRVCLESNPVPQYVVVSNQRDLHLYDLARDRAAPRLAIAVDDLPKYSEAFPFFAVGWEPGKTPTIINVSKVSGEVAELVAKLYRSLKKQHPERERDVVQFTLQCILTMFAEDIGLLPQEHFTALLYEGARHGDIESRLAELFRLMSTRDVKGTRAVPFFNGGLFSKPVTLPLGEAQLAALTKASEANWTYVDPHIFGSVFQGIMNDAERHKSGAHYTAHDDIMRVVGPTIVEPWRKRIAEATTLEALLEVRKELLAFRVLDPACGSGNFLYVAFRELYKLDTALLRRIHEYESTQGQGKAKVSWGVGIQASRFYGIDINPFAVELAKVTLNIAKKIAFDERRATAADLVGQLEIDVDPSLPLDNLDKNVVCADALFTEWPEVDAIVGNPPFLGGTKIRAELGQAYLQKLLERFPETEGRTDICVFWFRLAHERLRFGGRAGLVGTSGIRVGRTREASLDYIVRNSGTITDAVSTRAWPGDAAINVSMVNWIRGSSDGPHQLIVEDQTFLVEHIPTHLQLHADVSSAQEISGNGTRHSEGVSFGHAAFRSGGEQGFSVLDLLADSKSASVIRPVATGDDLLRGRLSSSPDYCVDLSGFRTESEAKLAGGRAFEHLRRHVYTELRARVDSGKSTDHYKSWLRVWWKPHWGREQFFATLKGQARVLVCPKVLARSSFSFISALFVPNNTLEVFAYDDDYSFGIIESETHWGWMKATGGKVAERIRYTNDVWTTFPWPQEPSVAEVVAVAEAARNLRKVRDTLMKDNGWSLRALYQAAEVPGPHPLKTAQAALDDAVRRAYAMPEGAEPTAFLLELNKLVAEDEAAGHPVQGPGVPRGMDPRDPRLLSEDCIEPPKVPGG